MNNLIKKSAAITTVAATIFAASTAFAGTHLLEYVYYSNSAKTTVVGEKIVRCDNTIYATGNTSTPYYRLVGSEPCSQEPGGRVIQL
ncbi:MAG: hypothetical protein HRT35_31220 [Algicola sp.]|nr:hypothetical protein [Algicola sp.]